MLVPNLRAIVARELCRIGGLGRLWQRGSENPTEEYARAISLRHRPRMLVLANRVYTGKGDFSIEDLMLLEPVELAAVCELFQAAQSGAAALEDWIRRWAARPVLDRTDLPETDDPPKEHHGEFRLEAQPPMHRRSR